MENLLYRQDLLLKDKSTIIIASGPSGVKIVVAQNSGQNRNAVLVELTDQEVHLLQDKLEEAIVVIRG
jgi:hypothetical protein